MSGAVHISIPSLKATSVNISLDAGSVSLQNLDVKEYTSIRSRDDVILQSKVSIKLNFTASNACLGAPFRHMGNWSCRDQIPGLNFSAITESSNMTNTNSSSQAICSGHIALCTSGSQECGGTQLQKVSVVASTLHVRVYQHYEEEKANRRGFFNSTAPYLPLAIPPRRGPRQLEVSHNSLQVPVQCQSTEHCADQILHILYHRSCNISRQSCLQRLLISLFIFMSMLSTNSPGNNWCASPKAPNWASCVLQQVDVEQQGPRCPVGV